VSAAWGEEITLRIADHSISVHIANTFQRRADGLMHHTYLCERCGMLFVFPHAGKHNFWMKDTPMPLSIAFIDARGSILNIEEMDANSTISHTAQGLALYALEMKKGWFTKYGIKAHDRVEGLHQAPQGQ
jgi:hypothetical protein